MKVEVEDVGDEMDKAKTPLQLLEENFFVVEVVFLFLRKISTVRE